MTEKNLQKVAIWAPLRYSNIGDDMQAIAFANYIKFLGYEVKLFQLDASLAKIYGVESASTVDELCKDVNLCVIAGGALLTPFIWYKRLLAKQAREYENDFRDLYNATKKYPNLKFCALSMGGDGMVKNPKKWYSQWRIKFFSSKAFLDGTVRLSGDVEQMKQAFNKNFVYYPDMLFKTADYFKPEKLSPTNKKRVCLQFKKRYLDEKLKREIYRYAANNDDIEFHFISTHMPKVGLTYQYLPPQESRNIFIDTYKTPNQLLGVIASCDLLLTSMLHVGLMGLTTGTPFLSYRGPGKTKAFLRSIGGDWAIVDDDISFEQLREEYFTQSREQLYNQFDVNVIEYFKTESGKHYEMCSEIVEKYA